MRKYCFPLCVIFPLAMGSAQATVTGAFNSGTDNNGALLIYTGGPGTLDTHYTLTGPSGTPAVVVNPNTYPAGNGTWMPDAASLVSLWIGPLADFNPNGSYPFIGSFQYRLVLNAAAGDSVSGRWASDNTAVLRLNGQLTGNSISAGDATDFKLWHPFTVNGLLVTPNNLDFVVNNTGDGPTGLRVEFTTAVPEPSTWLQMGLGSAALLLWLSRQRQRPAGT